MRKKEEGEREERGKRREGAGGGERQTGREEGEDREKGRREENAYWMFDVLSYIV